MNQNLKLLTFNRPETLDHTSRLQTSEPSGAWLRVKLCHTDPQTLIFWQEHPNCVPHFSGWVTLLLLLLLLMLLLLLALHRRLYNFLLQMVFLSFPKQKRNSLFDV